MYSLPNAYSCSTPCFLPLRQYVVSTFCAVSHAVACMNTALQCHVCVLHHSSRTHYPHDVYDCARPDVCLVLYTSSPCFLQVVWERLDTVDGDTQLCGADFQPYQPRHSALSDPGGVRVNMDALAAIPAEALAGMSEADAAAIAEAAGLLNPMDHMHAPAHQNNAVVPYTGGAGMMPSSDHQNPPQHIMQGRSSYSDAVQVSLAAETGGAYHQSAGPAQGGHGPGYVDEDADLALAIQLQQEEEERARAAQRREREAAAAAAAAQRQEYSQHQQGAQYQQQQQQHHGAYVPPQYAGPGQQFQGQHLQYGGAPQQQYGYAGAATQQQYQQAGYGYQQQQQPQGRPRPAANAAPAEKPSDWTDKCSIM